MFILWYRKIRQLSPLALAPAAYHYLPPIDILSETLNYILHVFTITVQMKEPKIFVIQ